LCAGETVPLLDADPLWAPRFTATLRLSAGATEAEFAELVTLVINRLAVSMTELLPATALRSSAALPTLSTTTTDPH